jgi:DNA-binding NtrC family response regulator
MGARVIIVGSGTTLAELVAPILTHAGYEVQAVDAPADVARVEEDGPGVLVLDACLLECGGPPAGVGELRKHSSLPILQVSGCATVDAASRTHPTRADGFLVRPFDAGECLTVVEHLVAASRDRTDHFHGMYATSTAMEKVFEAVRLVAPTESTVLIRGETGTGKEMVARAIHECSQVAPGPFIPLDCGSLSESLLASELFGHARGSFTGAEKDKRGLIEAAEGGTLFLDEVGNMPSRLQTLLLRAIQERQVRRVGDTRMLSVDTRFVAATCTDLREQVEQGSFRRDLYYRLKVFTIEVPPLRERPEDVDRIVETYLGSGDAVGDGRRGITSAALMVLRRYPWPGNVRELLSALETARIRAGSRAIGVDHLPADILADLMGTGGDGPSRVPRERDLTEAERILMALHRCDGNRSGAAALLGISRTTLWRRIRSLDLEIPSFG